MHNQSERKKYLPASASAVRSPINESWEVNKPERTSDFFFWSFTDCSPSLIDVPKNRWYFSFWHRKRWMFYNKVSISSISFAWQKVRFTYSLQHTRNCIQLWVDRRFFQTLRNNQRFLLLRRCVISLRFWSLACLRFRGQILHIILANLWGLFSFFSHFHLRLLFFNINFVLQIDVDDFIKRIFLFVRRIYMYRY